MSGRVVLEEIDCEFVVCNFGLHCDAVGNKICDFGSTDEFFDDILLCIPMAKACNDKLFNLLEKNPCHLLTVMLKQLSSNK